MPESLRKLQRAVYEMLTQDTTLMQSVGAVYDGVPEQPLLPCVVLGKADVKEWSTKTASGKQMVMHVHVVDDAESREKTHTIAERVHSLLETGYMQLEALAVVAKRVEDAHSDML